jgi:hypothetical protein
MLALAIAHCVAIAPAVSTADLGAVDVVVSDAVVHITNICIAQIDRQDIYHQKVVAIKNEVNLCTSVCKLEHFIVLGKIMYNHETILLKKGKYIYSKRFF